MKKKALKAPGKAVNRERLNHLMNAMVFIIARRQMSRHWPPVHRTTLGSIV